MYFHNNGGLKKKKIYAFFFNHLLFTIGALLFRQQQLSFCYPFEDKLNEHLGLTHIIREAQPLTPCLAIVYFFFGLCGVYRSYLHIHVIV